MEKLVKLSILSLTPSSFGSSSFILLLQDVNDLNRIFPIVIGNNEAQAISIIRDDIKISRPLTHHLFADLIKITDCQLIKVVIVDFKEGIFYANMFFKSAEKEFFLDARPSDAICIALHSNAEICISEKLLETISIPVDNALDNLQEDSDLDLDYKEENLPSLDKLQSSMEKAILEENYELAARIRDSINKFK